MGTNTCDSPSRNLYRKGCRCDGCRAANTQWSREYHAKMRGGARPTVPAQPVEEYIRYLMGNGMTLTDISAASGVNYYTIQGIANGRNKRVKRTTAEGLAKIGKISKS